VLLVWIDGRLRYLEPSEEDASVALPERPKGFLLVAERNWEKEVRARQVKLPTELQRLYRLPDGEAVDRLIGYQEKNGTWHPGIASLLPHEAHVLRRRVLERWQNWEVAEELYVKVGSVYVYLHEARSKLKELFGLEHGKVASHVTRVPACEAEGLVG
jgi:DNA-directed RNA polymerase specialized sigma24 family protein